MGRKKVDPIRNYFSLNNVTNSQFCNVTSCRIEISNNQAANMRRHIKIIHPDTYKQYQMDLLHNTKTKKSVREPITIKTNSKEMKQACIEMIAKGGCTFNLINSRGFRQIIGPIAKALDVTINAATMKSEFSATSAVIRSSISNELRDKIFSVKIDEATRPNRSIMGINLQYIIDNTIHVKTLGMIELTERHTAIYLKNIIMETLASFDLSLDQIYTITSDNGRNMLKASNLLNNELNSSAQSNEEETIEGECIDEIIQPRDLSEIAELIVAENKSQFLVNSIKCAAHTIQLAVNDTLKEANLKNNIATMRKFAIYLRTPTHRNFLKQNKLNQPFLNTPTRWNSTYDMLERLLQTKDYCKSHQHEYVELNIQEHLWNFAVNFIEVFSPVKKITLYLQQTQLVIGDFFKSWLELKLSIKNLAHPLARTLLTKLELREKKLIENQIISTAMVLDPRFNCMVSEDNRKKCITHLKKLYDHSKRLEGTEHTDVRSAISTKTPCSSSSSTSSVSMDINQLLKEYISTQSEINRPINTAHEEAYREIENYCPRRLNVNTNVLDYWMVMQPELPVLSQLAKIVHAVPATQCSVERCFSSLKLLLSDQRSRLSADLINDILIVKCNSNFEYEEEY